MMNELAKNGFKGSWLHRETGEVFALRIVDVVDPDMDHSHELKNESHFRSCTEKEFNKQFERL